MALTEYNRSSDQGKLVRDANLEVLEVFYPPHFDDIEDAGVGGSSIVKKGAICTVIHDDKTKLAVYQGDGEWLITGESNLRLGDTAFTAHRGDHGKAAYEHSQEEGNPHNTQIADIANLPEALAEAGSVKTVNEIEPDLNGNVQIEKAALGLSDVDNTADVDKPVSTYQQIAIDLAISTAASDATTKANTAEQNAADYTDAGLAGKVAKSGDAMTGTLEVMAGTTSDAPLIIPQGVLKTVLQDGAIERDAAGDLFITNGSSRLKIATGDLIPYTGADKAVNLNNQNLTNVGIFRAGTMLIPTTTVEVPEKNRSYYLITHANGMPVAKLETQRWTGTGFGTSDSNGFGLLALQNNTGSYSSGFGNLALQNNTGSNSSGFGNLALQNNTGSYSSGFGSHALRNNTGNASNGFGYAALLSNKGSYNNAFGHNVLPGDPGAVIRNYITAIGYNIPWAAITKDYQTVFSGREIIGLDLTNERIDAAAGNALVTKDWVNSNAVKKSGDTMAGTLQLMPGAASSVPLKIPQGVLTTVPQNGALESDGSNIYITLEGVRYPVIQQYLITGSDTINMYASVDGIIGERLSQTINLVTNFPLTSITSIDVELDILVKRFSNEYLKDRTIEIQASINSGDWHTISNITFSDLIAGDNSHALPISGTVRITKKAAGLTSAFWRGCYYNSWNSHRTETTAGVKEFVDLRSPGIGIDEWNSGVLVSLRAVTSGEYKKIPTTNFQSITGDIDFKIKRII